MRGPGFFTKKACVVRALWGCVEPGKKVLSFCRRQVFREDGLRRECELRRGCYVAVFVFHCAVAFCRFVWVKWDGVRSRPVSLIHLTVAHASAVDVCVVVVT